MSVFKIYDIDKVNFNNSIFYLTTSHPSLSLILLNKIKKKLNIEGSKPIYLPYDETFSSNIQNYIHPGLFNETEIIQISNVDKKNFKNIFETLKTSTSSNIFIMINEQKHNDISEEITVIDCELKPYEMTKLVMFYEENYNLSLTNHQRDLILINSHNNINYISNLFLQLSLNDNALENIMNQSNLNGFDIIRKLSSNDNIKPAFVRYKEQSDDPIMLLSQIFWFVKALLRYKMKPNINLAELKIFGDMQSLIRSFAAKVTLTDLQSIERKLHEIDKINKGIGFTNNPWNMTEKILLFLQQRLQNAK